MGARSFIEILDGEISRWSLLKHPFYQDWQAGKLSLDDLRIYVTQYYRFEEAFPRFLSGIHHHCPDREVRQMLLRNLWDEENGSMNHRALWLDFCSALSLSPKDVSEAPCLRTTGELLEVYDRYSASDCFQEGLAAVYAYESQVPKIMQTKLEGLRDWYGIDGSQSNRFFVVHKDLDISHAKLEAEAITQHVTHEHRFEIQCITNRALSAWWGFLDGVQIERTKGKV